jgi:hypothetical protein
MGRASRAKAQRRAQRRRDELVQEHLEREAATARDAVEAQFGDAMETPLTVVVDTPLGPLSIAGDGA